MRQQRGFSLLEVAIAMGVLAVGLSGLCALLIKSAAGVASVSHRANAQWLAERLASEIKLVPDALPALASTAPVNADCTPDTPCPPVDFAAASLARWRVVLAQTLPSGDGAVCRDSSPGDGYPGDWACDGEGDLVVKLAWREIGAEGDWSGMYRKLRP